MTLAARRRRSSWLPALLILTGVLVIDAGLFVWQAERTNAIIAHETADWVDHAQSLVRLFRENVTSTLQRIKALHALARLVSDAHHRNDPAAERAALRELGQWNRQNDGSGDQIGAIGPDGYVEWTNAAPANRPVYVGDRAHFQVIASGQAKEYISAPVTGRISGRRTLQFSMGNYEADGSLRDVTVVSINISSLSALAAVEGIAGGDKLTLMRGDGMILSRNDNSVGETLPPGTAFLHPMFAEAKGTLQGPSPIDGIERVVAWERLPDETLIVFASLDREARLRQLAPQLDQTRRFAALAAVMVALAGVGLVFALRSRRQMAAAEARVAMLRDSESMFRRLAENLPEFIRLLDTGGKVVYANAASRDLLGVEPDALLGDGSDNFLHPDDMDKIVSVGIARGVGGDRARAKVRLIRADGKIIWVETEVRGMSEADRENGIGAITSTRDITWQVEAEAALRHANEELEALLQATRGALYRARHETDDNVTISFISDSIESMTGYTPAEAMRPGWLTTYMDPAFTTVMSQHLAQLRLNGNSSMTLRFRHKAGHWIWLTVSTRLSVADDGRPSSVGFARDVTREHHADMQLAQAAKLAILGEMTTGIAHELNQPLAAISMAAQNGMTLLELGPDFAGPAQQKFSRILTQATRAAAIIDHMRVFGRKQDEAPAPVDIGAAIQGAIEVAEVRLSRTNVALDVLVAPDLPPVTGHLVLLEQVLVNLIGNAVDAIEAQPPPLRPGHRRITLTASRDGDWVMIRIADTAGGIEPALLPRVFEPFFTTKPVGTGTGLGLSISYGIITDMGGTVMVTNEGGGAVFTIRLLPADAGTILD